MEVAKAAGRVRGKQPKLKPNQAKPLLELHDSATQAELAEPFSVERSTIYRTIDRVRPQPVEPARPFAHILQPFPNTEISTPPLRGQGLIGRKRAPTRTCCGARGEGGD